MNIFVVLIALLAWPLCLVVAQPSQVETIRVAYHELGLRVRNAVQAHVGDFQLCDRQRRIAAQFLTTIELVCYFSVIYQEDHMTIFLFQHEHAFDSIEYTTICTGIHSMIEALDIAATQSQDPPTIPPLLTTHTIHSGRRGRPKIEINVDILAQALEYRGSTHLGSVFGCSSRTVRRRALDNGLAQPGPPVYITYEDEESGELLRWYSSSTPTMSTLSNDELDAAVRSILEVFPSFGRRMITGHLRHHGHRVSRERLRQSYERVMGAPAALTHRVIERRRYHTAGPNSLWHHDGQHGLIRWRIVIHAFIDGFSRLVTGIQASDNNRAETVFNLFNEAIHTHGIPSRVRGDHGVENLLVAEFMESNFGVLRGSYIWGRSVHNIRIERLWVDVTRAFGVKWYNFFSDLELHAGLDPNQDTHIWLLHTLFLPSLNQDAMEWAETWNRHNIRFEDERDRSPRDMFFFGVLQLGLRGESGIVEPINEDVDDIAAYGVDWADLADRSLLTHHTQRNPNGEELLNSNGNTRQPEHLALVEIPSFECPLTDEEAEIFGEAIISIPQIASGTRDMIERRSSWAQALALLNVFLSV
ncbi:hypothetical protein H0H93_015236 [Arthromyces matolae]|nr:hypothetical protein H0H93_015236 [Arthromyces matolae]